jgi:paraquat-inducible protein A
LLSWSIALAQPLFKLHLLGRLAVATPLSGPHTLFDRGLDAVGAVVALTLFAAPLLHVALLSWGLICSFARTPRRWMVLPLGLLDVTRRWMMVDVYLLAALVCYVRLQAWASVSPGRGLVGAVCFLLITFAAESAMDVPGLWKRVPVRVAAPTPHGQYIACSWCAFVECTIEGRRCARCGRHLMSRKHASIGRSCALLIAAALLCVPANLLPVMDFIRFGRSGPRTILGGVLELTQHHMWGLSAVIFVASILVPLLKIVGLSGILWMTAHGRAEYLHRRARLYRVLQTIGRWSLVDVYAVTILVSLVHLGRLASVVPGYGAVAFCAVVILTMLATEAFDPRLMWDAAGAANGLERSRRT